MAFALARLRLDRPDRFQFSCIELQTTLPPASRSLIISFSSPKQYSIMYKYSHSLYAQVLHVSLVHQVSSKCKCLLDPRQKRYRCLDNRPSIARSAFANRSLPPQTKQAIAACALFLAAKVEEQPRKLEHVIKVAHWCLNTKPKDRQGTQLDVKSPVRDHFLVIEPLPSSPILGFARFRNPVSLRFVCKKIVLL